MLGFGGVEVYGRYAVLLNVVAMFMATCPALPMPEVTETSPAAVHMFENQLDGTVSRGIWYVADGALGFENLTHGGFYIHSLRFAVLV